jgi:predicted SAM-dependent methyltransferase
MTILNLGCGKRYVDGAINIDIKEPANMLTDLTKLPWLWRDNSIDGIYTSHFLEHTQNPKEILQECHRILKPYGFLSIKVPHSSCAAAVGCLSHYRTFSYNSLKDYLSPKMFETIHQRIVWLPHYEWLPIQWLIDLSPIFFERGLGYIVGGATQVEWTGLKCVS